MTDIFLMILPLLSMLFLLDLRLQIMALESRESRLVEGGYQLSRPCPCLTVSCSALFSISDRSQRTWLWCLLYSYFLRQIYSFGVLLCVVLTNLKDVKVPYPPQWGCRPNPLLLIFGQRSREGALQKDVTMRSLRDGQMGQILVINLSGVVDSSYSATDRRWSLGE